MQKKCTFKSIPNKCGIFTTSYQQQLIKTLRTF